MKKLIQRISKSARIEHVIDQSQFSKSIQTNPDGKFQVVITTDAKGNLGDETHQGISQIAAKLKEADHETKLNLMDQLTAVSASVKTGNLIFKATASSNFSATIAFYPNAKVNWVFFAVGFSGCWSPCFRGYRLYGQFRCS